MRLTADDGHRPPSKDLLDEGAHVRQMGLVVQPRAPVGPNDAIELLPRREQRLGEGAHGEHGGDERAARRVGPGAEEIARQRGDLLRLEVVLGRLSEEELGVAVIVARSGVGLVRERVEEVMATVGFSALA